MRKLVAILLIVLPIIFGCMNGESNISGSSTQSPEAIIDSISSAGQKYTFNGHGTTPDGIRNRMFGSEGVLETQYGGNVIIKGNHHYRGGRSPGIFLEGAVNNIATFHKYITEGNHENVTVEASVTSNLVTILGRTAAYQGRPVYWHQLLEDDERLRPNLDGLND